MLMLDPDSIKFWAATLKMSNCKSIDQSGGSLEHIVLHVTGVEETPGSTEPGEPKAISIMLARHHAPNLFVDLIEMSRCWNDRSQAELEHCIKRAGAHLSNQPGPTLVGQGEAPGRVQDVQNAESNVPEGREKS